MLMARLAYWHNSLGRLIYLLFILVALVCTSSKWMYLTLWQCLQTYSCFILHLSVAFIHLKCHFIFPFSNVYLHFNENLWFRFHQKLFRRLLAYSFCLTCSVYFTSEIYSYRYNPTVGRPFKPKYTCIKTYTEQIFNDRPWTFNLAWELNQHSA